MNLLFSYKYICMFFILLSFIFYTFRLIQYLDYLYKLSIDYCNVLKTYKLIGSLILYVDVKVLIDAFNE